MAFKVNTSISFEDPPTLDEAIAALERLRDGSEGAARLRVRTQIGFNADGGYPSRFIAEQEGKK